MYEPVVLFGERELAEMCEPGNFLCVYKVKVDTTFGFLEIEVNVKMLTDRQTDRQTDRRTDRQTDRQTDRHH